MQLPTTTLPGLPLLTLLFTLSIELHVPETTNTIIIIGLNENNVEELDAESSSMDSDKYRIHMDGDNIYVIYASPSQSSNPVKIADSSVLKIDTSPINQFEQQQKSSSSFSSFPPYGYKLQNLPKPSSSYISSTPTFSSSKFLYPSSFKTVVQPESIKTYRAGSEDDSGNYLLNLHDTKNLNRFIS